MLKVTRFASGKLTANGLRHKLSRTNRAGTGRSIACSVNMYRDRPAGKRQGPSVDRHAADSAGIAKAIELGEWEQCRGTDMGATMHVGMGVENTGV